MKFPVNHHRNLNFNFTGENRLVFMRPSEDGAQTTTEQIQTLDLEIQNLKNSLKNTADLEAAEHFKKQIAELEAEKEKLKAAELDVHNQQMASSSILLNGLQNRVNETEDPVQKQKLYTALESFRTPVNSEDKANETFDDIERFDRFLAKIQSGDIDYLHIEDLLNSSLGNFIDNAFEGSLRIMAQQMHTTDAQGVILEGLDTEAIRQAALKDWMDYDASLDSEINQIDNLAKEHLELHKQGKSRTEIKAWIIQKSTDPSLTEGLRSLLSIQGNQDRNRYTFQRLLKRHAKNIEGQKKKQSTWIKSRVIKLRAQNNRKLTKNEFAEKLGDLTNFVNEARANKVNQMRHYMQGRLGTMQSDFENKKSQFNESQQKGITEVFDKFAGLLSQPQANMADLKQLYQNLQFGEESLKESLRTSDGVTARKTMHAIGRANNLAEVQAVLSEHLEEGKTLQYVDKEEFEAKYRKYTAEGFMVMAEVGNEWKVIISREAFENEANTEQLKEQIAHEMLHVEFERDEGRQQEIMAALTSNKKLWKKIKKQFVVAMDGKFPPNHTERLFRKKIKPSDWTDKDIASEIYAMRDVWRKEYNPNNKHPKNILRGLIIQTALYEDANIDEDLESMLGAYTEDINGRELYEMHGYEGIEEERIHGAEGDEGEDEASVETITENTDVANVEEKANFDKIKDDVNDLDAELERWINSEYVAYIAGAGAILQAMQKYNNGSKELLEKNPHASEGLLTAVSERTKEIKSDLKELTGKLMEQGMDAGNQKISGFRRVWNRTTFMSFEDIIQVGKDVYEWLGRRHKRQLQDHAAKLGSALMQGTTLGHEFEARQLKAEAEEVSEWEGRIDNKDAWQLEDHIKELAQSANPSADQLKAVLRVLAKKGRINWRNPHLWQVINKLQNVVHLSPDDEVLQKSPIILRQKLHTALGNIWDYGEFLDLERNNESSYQSEKDKYNGALDRFSESITPYLDGILRRIRSGENVDPQEYEAGIEYALKAGKSNPEAALFHLMVGMAEGILPPDRGIALDNKYLNNFPPIQWFFFQGQKNTSEWKALVQKKFKASFEAGKPGADFVNFFWTDILNHPGVESRVRKSVGERGWDHDWGRAVVPMGDAQTAKQFLAGRSGQQESKPTAVANAYAGTLQWLEENAKNRNTPTNPSAIAKRLGVLVMTDGFLNYAAYVDGKTGAKVTEPARANATMLNETPREHSMTNHENMTLGGTRDHFQNLLNILDPQLFAILRTQVYTKPQGENHAAQVKEIISQRYTSVLPIFEQATNIDDIFEKLDDLMLAVTNAAQADGRLAAFNHALAMGAGGYIN